MDYENYRNTFYGKRIVEITSEDTGRKLSRCDFANVALRLTTGFIYVMDGVSDRDLVTDLVTSVLAHPDVEWLESTLLSFCDWTAGDTITAHALELLCSAGEQLPNLRHLFLSELPREECQISWIQHGDVRELFRAFPLLESCHVRGSHGLVLGPISHRHLRTLHIESGGLDRRILKQIADSDLPQLTDLTVFIGQPEHGWNGTVTDVRTLIDAVYERYPKLKRLGLPNMDGTLADEIASYLATHPILDRLEELDLSLGTFGDIGANALLAGGKLFGLESLDVSHNYLSDQMHRQLEALPIDVNAARGNTAASSRRSAIGE